MTALQRLRLNGCKLSSEGTEALADTLRHLLQLTELGLDGNQFDNPTAGQALADSLSKMTALQRLSLNGCKLSSEGTEALANALHHLPQLTTLRCGTKNITVTLLFLLGPWSS
ncbi:hypothetical protein LSAT2_000644 [Lamellibrachia satsuma]|nr:hypothetical protein LSAT2_000644 [Lamellibrachia satsuma]